MKILFLTYKLPHSEVVGGNRIVFQRIRDLAARGHKVGLVSYVSDETPQQISSMKQYVSVLHTIPAPHRGIFFRVFHDYLAAPSRPAQIWKLYSREMMKTVADAVEEQQYDLVISEFSEMGQFLYKNPALSAVHKVMSCHRCMTASYEKYREIKEVRWRQHLKSFPQLHALRKYEFNMYRSADRVLVFTAQDRFTMQYYAPDLAISVAPAGVDIEELQKNVSITREPIILMTGYMQDPANEDGVNWFFHHIWSELRTLHPDLKFYIVGADPSYRIKRLVQHDNRIVITGKVDDLRPYRARACMLVSPIRLGSGMRTKVLEAMASGLPVVSTSLGVQGIEAQTGVNCLVADTPELFKRSVDWLLTDQEFASRMARNAKELIEKKHTLEAGLIHFEKILKSVVEG
jgi:glycosyltransferase involved in cell wall biosynthesis